MKAQAGVVPLLNEVLKNELTAINQYFLHSRMFADWGLAAIAKKEYEESIDEMKHADKLIARVLFLGGLPNLQDLGRLRIGENTKEIIECDLALEHDALPALRRGVKHCEDCQDYITRDLFQHILESEEEHVDWLETQLHLIDTLGIQNYNQLQVGEAHE